MRRLVRLGPLVFRDPLLLCGGLYLLFWLDASGFLRIGLCAALLHELGHILVYLGLFRRLPVIEVNAAGFCMRTREQRLTPAQTFALAAAGPGMNALLALLWAMKLQQHATVRGSAFLAANLITGAFNLLPVPPLDGAQMITGVRAMFFRGGGKRMRKTAIAFRGQIGYNKKNAKSVLSNGGTDV